MGSSPAPRKAAGSTSLCRLQWAAGAHLRALQSGSPPLPQKAFAGPSASTEKTFLRAARIGREQCACVVKNQADEKSSCAAPWDPLKLPLTKADYLNAPSHCTRRNLLAGSSQCIFAPNCHPHRCPCLWPLAPCAVGTHPALLPRLPVLSPPLFGGENSFALFAVKHMHCQAPPASQPRGQASPCPSGTGCPAPPSWQPASFWSWFRSFGAHARLVIKSEDSLCSKQESRRYGSFSSLGRRGASQ